MDRQKIHKAVVVLKLSDFTFQEIGDMFGFSRQRAHQIYKEEIDKFAYAWQEKEA